MGTGSTATSAERLRAHYTPARFREWAAAAQPGARVLYGVGHYAQTAAAPGVAVLLYGLARQGFVDLLQRRRSAEDVAAGYGFDYLAYRTRREWGARLERSPMPKWQADLLDEIEIHCAVSRITPVQFGLRAANDGRLVNELRSGRSLTQDMLGKVRRALEAESC